MIYLSAILLVLLPLMTTRRIPAALTTETIPFIFGVGGVVGFQLTSTSTSTLTAVTARRRRSGRQLQTGTTTRRTTSRFLVDGSEDYHDYHDGKNDKKKEKPASSKNDKKLKLSSRSSARTQPSSTSSSSTITKQDKSIGSTIRSAIAIGLILLATTMTPTLPRFLSQVATAHAATETTTATTTTTTTASNNNQIIEYYTSSRINQLISNQQIDSRAIERIIIDGTDGSSLGIELGITTLRGQTIVYIKNIIKSTKLNSKLQSGMILLDYKTPQDVINDIQVAQSSSSSSSPSSPSPLVLQFYNLAAGGDAFNDFGKPLVTAQDAFNLAKRTDSSSGSGGGGIVSLSSTSSSRGGGGTQQQSQQLSQSIPYSKTILQSVPKEECSIQSRRNDVLEIVYDAFYFAGNGGDGGDGNSPNPNSKVVLYDSSSFRGTGRPYQMVLGSGDVLNGVDLGLYNMCPGEKRQIIIPSSLAYGTKGNKLYKIPPNSNLQWNIELISIDTVITRENNIGDNMTRENREGRALYE